MSHEQKDNFKQSDQTTISQYDAVAAKAGAQMRDEVYGSGVNMKMTPEQHANMKKGGGHSHGTGMVEQTPTATASAAPAGQFDRATLAGMIQNGDLTSQQAIALSSPELASYLASFKTNKPTA